MPVNQNSYSNQGMRITVNSMIKDPLVIRQRVLRMADKQFIMEALLRKVPNTQSGVVQYAQEEPLFLNDEPEVVAEGAEIPVLQGSDAQLKAAHTIKLALGIEITQEMRDRNRVDRVQKRLDQANNTMVRAWENRMFSMVQGSGAPTVAATVPWDAVDPNTVKIRKDVLSGISAVSEALAGDQANDFLGFVPDTLVISTRTMYNMLLNDPFVKIYEQSPLVTKSPVYTGQLERQILGLNVMTSRFMPDTEAWVLEAKTIGGYSDERPLNVSPLRRDDDREVWRANMVRSTAMFMDEPKALARITGIKT